MTPQEEYDEAVRLAVGMAKATTPERICDCSIPFVLLYQEMVKRKEILSIQEIGRDKALLYWTQACLQAPQASKVKRLWIAEALYMFQLITQKQLA